MAQAIELDMAMAQYAISLASKLSFLLSFVRALTVFILLCSFKVGYASEMLK